MKTSEVISLLVFVVLLVAIVKLVNKVQALDRNMRAIAARIDSAGQDQVPARVGGFACGSTVI